MPIKICPKCGYKTEKEEEVFLLACPRCGAFYGAVDKPERGTVVLGASRKRARGKTVQWIIVSLALLLILGGGFYAGKQYLLPYIPFMRPAAPEQSTTSSASRPAQPSTSHIDEASSQQVSTDQIPPVQQQTSASTQAKPDAQPEAAPLPAAPEIQENSSPRSTPETKKILPENASKQAAPRTEPVKPRQDGAAKSKADDAAQKKVLDQISPDYGILTITAKTDTTVYFQIPLTRKRLGPYTVGKGKQLDVKLKKGSYVVEIHCNGERTFTSINFIGNAGSLDL